jgi:hypothetical protein
MRSKFLACAMLIAVSVHTGAFAQQVSLVDPAEYEGAFLRNAPYPVNFYETGRVMNGVLKVDYIRDDVTYLAESFVWFFDNGKVWKGVLKGPLKLNDLTFEAGNIEYFPSGAVRMAVIKEGTTIDGVFIPLKADVTFRDDGRMANIAFQAQNNQVYRVLHRTIRGNNFNVAWNKDTGRYEFQNYTTGVNQLVARIAPQWTQASIPQPFTAVPVIVPPGSTMSRNNANPAETFWSVPTPGNYVLNGVNYGPNALLKLRDMQLLSIQVRQAVTVGGVTYPSGTSVAFDVAGRPLPIGM